MIPFFLLVACVIAVIASITDVLRFKVYNALTFPAMALGVIYHSVAPHGMGFSYGACGLVVGMGALLIPYGLGIFGAGDAKFVGAIGAWIGVESVFTALMVGAIASGLYAVILLCMRGGISRAWNNLQLTAWSLMNIRQLHESGVQNETVQQVASASDRRSRLIPFSAMASVGVAYVVISMAM